MGQIQILPERIANKIAAGEVVERPASIVKELVENALDAGASGIEIAVENGGKSLIRVTDDGCGMDREDARLAFQRHATSKISSIEDLESIRSFGFRGEALPSIAAISRTKLTTRRKADGAGTEIAIDGGGKPAVKDQACRAGTIVEVRDLFFNTPARRKFAKSDSTELGHIQDLVEHLALSALEVRFKLTCNGKVVLDLPPAKTLLQRAAALLGDETGRWLLELDHGADGLRVTGLIGKPSQTRANRSGQTFFINKRWVRSPAFSHALQAGYHGLIMHGRFPVGVLFLTMDLNRVDVNVHPAKQEVRISQEAEVTELIRRAVKERLGKASDLAPPLGLPSRFEAATAKPYTLKTGEAVAVHETAAPPMPQSQQIPLEKPLAFRDSLHVTKILGQVHNTFLVAETREGLIVVDQHAAHERVQYEALLKNFTTGKAERQTLLLEEVLKVHPKRRELLEKAMPMLERVGFEIDAFGDNAFVVRAYPALFGPVNPVQLLSDFLDEQEDRKPRTRVDEHPETLAALCACKRQSVKANDPLEPAAVKKLLERLSQCDNPFTCPHGRPVFFTQTLSELEKQFKRV